MKKNLLSLLSLFCFLILTSCKTNNIENKKVISDASISFSIENPTTADFMTRSYSTFDANSPSFLNDEKFQALRSAALERSYRNDQPIGRLLTLMSDKPTEVSVLLATDKTFTNIVDKKTVLCEKKTQVEFKNFVPNHTYYYKVISKGNVKGDTQGKFLPSGQLRMISINSSWNIRDLGGWKGWSGNNVRYEWIYRGGSPGGQSATGETYFINDEDKAELHRIGIRAHLDLRSEPRKGAWPTDKQHNAFSLGYTPMLETDFINIATDFALYEPTKCSAVVGDIAWIISQLRKGHPVYFHCRTGADRTGSVAFTLLGLLGCDQYAGGNKANQIAIDYELTSLGMDEEGTLEYIANGTLSKKYSNRYANSIATSDYAFFRTMRTLEADGLTLSNLQERIYYYLNRYFYDHHTETAGRVFINKSDLDWFVNFMLGITDRSGNLTDGHTAKFVGPAWAIDEAGNTLGVAYTTAQQHQYAGH